MALPAVKILLSPLGGLPVVAGPILLVATLLHGRDFGADAAAGTLLGLAALTAFVVVYGRVATALGPVPSLLCGWAAFLAGVAVLSPVRRRPPCRPGGTFPPAPSPRLRWSSG